MTHLGSRKVLMAAAIVTVVLWQGSVFAQQQGKSCLDLYEGGWVGVFGHPGECGAYRKRVRVRSRGHSPMESLSREAPLVVFAAQIPHKNNPNPAPWITETFENDFDPVNPKQEQWDWVFLVLGSKRCELRGILPFYPLLGGSSGASTLDGRLVFIFNYVSTLVYDAHHLEKGPILAIPYPSYIDYGVCEPVNCSGTWWMAHWPVTLGSGYYLLTTRGSRPFENTCRVIKTQGEHARVVGSLPATRIHLNMSGSNLTVKGLFADERSFAVLVLPPKGCEKMKGARRYVVAANYGISHPAAGRMVLPDGARRVDVVRDDHGGLTCKYSLGDAIKEKPIALKRLDVEGHCRFNETQARWNFWVDGSGEIFQLPGKKRVDYTRKPDGSHYTFFPYRRYSYVHGSPQGRYLVVKGALRPDENPNGPGSQCDRPGFFHKGYDSVVLVYDTRKHEVVRIFNIWPHGTGGIRFVFSNDDKLFFINNVINNVGGTHIYDTSRWESPPLGALPYALYSDWHSWPVRLAGKGDTPGSVRYLAARHGGLVLLERADSGVKELMKIPSNKLASELSVGVPRPLPVAGSLGLVGCPGAELAGGGANTRWPVLQVINLRTRAVSKPLTLLQGARDVKLVRRKDGTLACRFQTEKGVREMAIVPLKK